MVSDKTKNCNIPSSSLENSIENSVKNLRVITIEILAINIRPFRAFDKSRRNSRASIVIHSRIYMITATSELNEYKNSRIVNSRGALRFLGVFIILGF